MRRQNHAERNQRRHAGCDQDQPPLHIFQEPHVRAEDSGGQSVTTLLQNS
jgi:hypothetical protein